MTATDTAGHAGTGLEAAVDRAEELLRGRGIAVLTGAGVSTDSGIPDYRGAGAPVRSPMTIQQFLADERAQQRYWAGSHLGWKHFSAAQPNAGHAALAELERGGVVGGIATQNVDGLHLRAGSRRVVEIHGSVDRVRCLVCGQAFAREDIADRMAADNPWLDAPEGVQLNPDGDVTVESVERMVLPSCTVCAGRLKPEVVFFGEFVPTETFREAAAIVRRADALIVAGSSLVVNSGIRLLDIAVKRRVPIVIVNRGETRGDARATLKIDAGTSTLLGALRDRLLA
ncbi:Sir2 family NAD-dependent protein deacetylase [Homoserinibacter sp. YIM 151385]|uniref:Sir2 family NAD-dependent protein deacetylase n=1 Tax=Homoserinibacter sp. YIM 151385 TaxID=2985506 RepID=UPI0022F084F7|nr:Sir2 family NAD-dependent protein deacetylase [Homoserinibacter sp. YIM 151385]WBU38571.1 NAD-dependent deacetylase [Homoserinibacter sp. YIM 151385]